MLLHATYVDKNKPCRSVAQSPDSKPSLPLSLPRNSFLCVFFARAGSGKGGDCDHLLLASSPDKFIQIRAHGGQILIDGTHVESWDIEAGGVDENDDDGRRCVFTSREEWLFLSPTGALLYFWRYCIVNMVDGLPS